MKKWMQSRIDGRRIEQAAWAVILGVTVMVVFQPFN
jgi:hypothetical protein